MKNKLTAWMRDNNCPNWTLGIRFVQWQMNTCVSEATGKEPYTLMFGKKPSLGLTTALPRDFLEKITPGISEDLTDLIVQTGSVDHTDAAPGANSTDVAAAAPDANSTDQDDLGTSSDRFVSQRVKAKKASGSHDQSIDRKNETFGHWGQCSDPGTWI
ncbi:hypothetical protein ACOMHN_024931 [Nucella lapillus]